MTLGDPLGVSAVSPDADVADSWFAGQAQPAAASAAFVSSDGLSITWQRGEPLVAGKEHLLTFLATNGDGTPAALEPYMGMLGHAAVTNADGSGRYRVWM
jgi:hypothetical protein